MALPDFETIKTLGAALTGISTLADIAGKINNAQLRQELNGKIADLQTAIISARQQSMEMQDKYEAALKEIKDLREQLNKQNAEVFLHGVWWLTSSYPDEEESELQGRQIYKTIYDGPYCPLCKDNNGKFVHLKPNGQTAPGGKLVYDCEIHNTDYEAPPMGKR